MTNNKAPVCGIEFINEEKVAIVKENFPDENEIFELAETFKMLGDPTRLKIVLALLISELCVCDLSALIGVSVSAISHQLRYLKNMRLVKFRREGKVVYYSLDDNHIVTIISETQKHVREN
ncbi:MAG: metalloregulator ArsR/SmtB family transcription factor [Bacteroidetes bacterium]|nr:metalloregulator ArsR/SmtB family transcription factor [Bacteroidota bacterium]